MGSPSKSHHCHDHEGLCPQIIWCPEKKNVNQISVSDIHKDAKINFDFFVNLQIWRLYSHLLDLLQWEVHKKAIIAMTLKDGAPKYFGVLKKRVNQINVSDIHHGAKINFDTLF